MKRELKTDEQEGTMKSELDTAVKTDRQVLYDMYCSSGRQWSAYVEPGKMNTS